MSDVKDKTVNFAKPSEADEDAKDLALQNWTNDRSDMVINWPFIGTLAMNLDLIPVVDYRCQTACTDGRRIFFNPHFLATLTPAERLTILAHEIWHCGLSHFTREHGRIEDHKMWNHAIDHEVNCLLRRDSFHIPEGAIIYEDYDGESAEYVFEKIKIGEIKMSGQTLDDHGPSQSGISDDDTKNDGTDGWSTIESDADGNLTVKIDSDFYPQRSDEVWKEWKAKMIAAAQQCQERGRDLSNYKRVLDDILQSKLPWREILRQYLTPLFDSTRKWLPPNRRYVHKRIYLPSIQKKDQLKIVIAVDTSGSTNGPIVAKFVSEVYSILNSFGNYQLRLIQCDMNIHQDMIFDSDRPFQIEKFSLLGGGGTDFFPVFDRLKKEREQPAILLFLTDGYGPAPKNPPKYPVIWGINEGGVKPVDWGNVIDIDIE